MAVGGASAARRAGRNTTPPIARRLRISTRAPPGKRSRLRRSPARSRPSERTRARWASASGPAAAITMASSGALFVSSSSGAAARAPSAVMKERRRPSRSKRSSNRMRRVRSESPAPPVRGPIDKAVVTTLDEIGNVAKLTPELCTFFRAFSKNQPLGGRGGLPCQDPLLFAKVKASQARIIGIDVAEKYETCRRGNEDEKPDPHRVTAQPTAPPCCPPYGAPVRRAISGSDAWARRPAPWPTARPNPLIHLRLCSEAAVLCQSSTPTPHGPRPRQTPRQCAGP